MLETVDLAGGTAMAGCTRTPLGGSTSFVTFPEGGLVVTVTANPSHKDTKSVALKIAEVFAAQGHSPAPK